MRDGIEIDDGEVTDAHEGEGLDDLIAEGPGTGDDCRCLPEGVLVPTGDKGLAWVAVGKWSLPEEARPG